MKAKITKYVADDGSEHTSERAALERDALIKAVDKAMAPMGKRINDCDFSNGSGFIQHDEQSVATAKMSLLKIIQKVCSHPCVDNSIKKPGSVHPSWIQRLVTDGNVPNCINNAWYRFCCIDTQWREWGQPYYASHPQAAKQVCLRKSK